MSDTSRAVDGKKAPLEPFESAAEQATNDAGSLFRQAAPPRAELNKSPGALHPHLNPEEAARKKKKKHKAEIKHNIPGRIRMKIPSAKANPALLETYANAFSTIPGIRRVEQKPATASIVIHYDPKDEAAFHGTLHATFAKHDTSVHEDRPSDEISEIARKIEHEAEFLAERSELARATVEFFKGFDAELKTVTDNTIDLKVVLAGGLAAFTFLEIGAEAATPMWVTLALFSLNHFVELQSHPSPAAAEASPKP